MGGGYTAVETIFVAGNGVLDMEFNGFTLPASSGSDFLENVNEVLI